MGEAGPGAEAVYDLARAFDRDAFTDDAAGLRFDDSVEVGDPGYGIDGAGGTVVAEVSGDDFVDRSDVRPLL